jgi:hypothetical protein
MPVPDIPFPRVNDTKSWQSHVGRMKMKAAMNCCEGVGHFKCSCGGSVSEEDRLASVG